MGTFLAAMGVRAKLAGVQETCLCLLQAGDIVFRQRDSRHLSKHKDWDFSAEQRSTKLLLPCLEDMYSFMFYGF